MWEARWDFPGSSVFKTPSFHYRGCGFHLWLGGSGWRETKPWRGRKKCLYERQEHLFQEILRWIRVGLCLDPKPCGIIISVGLPQKWNTRRLPQWFAHVVSFLSLIFLSISVGSSKGAASDSLCSAFSHKHTVKRGRKILKQPQKCRSKKKKRAQKLLQKEKRERSKKKIIIIMAAKCWYIQGQLRWAKKNESLVMRIFKIYF